MSQAAFKKTIQVKFTTSVGGFATMPASAASLSLAGDLLDDTDFTSTGMRSRIFGLRDWSVAGTINYDVTSTAIDIIRDSWLTQKQLTINYFPNGTAGFTGAVDVETFALTGSVADLETADFSFLAAGTLTTA